MSHIFTGTAVATTTPFNNGEVDYDAFREHLTFLKENGVKAFVVNGTTGESTTLTAEEQQALLKVALEVSDGKIPVVAGTGSNNTQEAIEKSKTAENLGVDGLLLITPYYNKTSQKGLIAHFTAIADAVKTPIILYDVPSRTGMSIDPETIENLARHENIVGIKDATGDLGHVSTTMQLVDDSFAFYSGNDDSALPFFSIGGHGIISVAANVLPNEYAELYEASQSDAKRAQELNNRLVPFVNALGIDVNPIPIKLLTSTIGFGKYEVRLPLVPLEEVNQIALVEAYRDLKGEK